MSVRGGSPSGAQGREGLRERQRFARHPRRTVTSPPAIGDDMTIDRRKFTKIAGAGAATVVVAWQQACAQVAETGEVSEETVRVLLNAQGAPAMYDDPEEFERLRGAIASSVRTSQQLRSFELSEDEQPITIFRRG